MMRNDSKSTSRKLYFASALMLIIFTYQICISGQAFGGGVLKPRVTMTPSVNLAEEIGQVFDVTINVFDACDIRTTRITMTYNSSLLDVEQVEQGKFFPQSPNSTFEFKENESLGTIKVNISLRDIGKSLSGNGTFFTIKFKVTNAPECPVSCPLSFEQTLLLNSASVEIEHDSVGSIYFWKRVQPDPPVGGRLLDLYTQHEGMGMDQFGGTFFMGSMINLTANVTYNDYPVQQKLVGFEVHDPLDQVAVVRTALTNENGLAEINFRIPITPDSVGTWSAIATVDIAEETTWDTLTFNVSSHIPVGGYSIATENHLPIKSFQTQTITTFALICFFLCLRKARKNFRMPVVRRYRDSCAQSKPVPVPTCTWNNAGVHSSLPATKLTC